MVGELPISVIICGVKYKLRTDYRDCLRILEAYNDPNLSMEDKAYIMLYILYRDFEQIPPEHIKEAHEKALWFLNCGNTIEESKNTKRVYDWEQDEQMIFSSINKVAAKEVRQCRYMHFWTFISYFHEIGEGLFSTVINIRNKKNKNKKLEKHEQEFYRENKALIDLKRKVSDEEQATIDRLNKILG